MCFYLILFTSYWGAPSFEEGGTQGVFGMFSRWDFDFEIVHCASSRWHMPWQSVPFEREPLQFDEFKDGSTSIGPVLRGDVVIWFDDIVSFRLWKAINRIVWLESLQWENPCSMMMYQ